MFLVSSHSCLQSIHWSQVLSWERRCSWSSADRRCSNNIWIINIFIAHKGVTYIRCFTVDELTACQQLKSLPSLSHRSLHLTLVTKRSRSWSWMTYSHPLCSMSIGPPILRYSYFKIWSWKSLVKAMRVVKRSRSHLTLKIQRSRSWPRSNLLFTFEAWGSINMFAFRFLATTFGWDIANLIFYLENSRSSSWPSSKLIVTFEA